MDPGSGDRRTSMMRHSERLSPDAAGPDPPPPEAVEELERHLSGVELKRADMNQVFQALRDLLGQVNEPRELLDAILAEYSRRLDEFPGAPILPAPGRELRPDDRQQLSLLVLFATQAVLLKDKAALFSRLRQAHQDLAAFSRRLRQALGEANESRQLLLGVLETLPMGIVVFDREGGTRYVNPIARGLLDLDAAGIIDPDAVTRLSAVAPPVAGEPGTLDEVEVLDEAGEKRVIQKRYVRLPETGDQGPLGLLLLLDVTEEHRLRDEIFRNGRLSAVLDTWTALNHEINNPLAAILGRAQMLLARGDAFDERTVTGLKVIEESARRIADLTAQLKEIAEPAFTEYSRGVMMLDIRNSRKRASADRG